MCRSSQKKTFKSSSKLLISKTIKPGCRVSQLIHLNTIAATLPSSAWAAPITKIFTEINRDLRIRKIIIYVHYLLGTLRLSHRPAIDWGSTFRARKLENFSIIQQNVGCFFCEVFVSKRNVILFYLVIDNCHLIF